MNRLSMLAQVLPAVLSVAVNATILLVLQLWCLQ
jgi:hypothetical protein